MPSKKNTRTDSTAAMLKSFKSAADGPPPPPDHVRLRDSDLPFWYSIVSVKGNDQWNTSDLEVAGNLARCKSDIERIQDELYEEGDLIKNDRGTWVMNPKHTLLEILSRRCVSLSRIIHVHSEAVVGKARDQAKKSKANQSAKDAVDSSDSELFARPH